MSRHLPLLECAYYVPRVTLAMCVSRHQSSDTLFTSCARCHVGAGRAEGQHTAPTTPKAPATLGPHRRRPTTTEIVNTYADHTARELRGAR